jgi:hypothetical protein
VITKTVTCKQADFNSNKCEVSLDYEHYSEDAPELSESEWNLWIVSIFSEGINYTWDKVFRGWWSKNTAEDLYAYLSGNINISKLKKLGFKKSNE